MKKKESIRTVLVGDETLSYILTRKPVKNLNLRILPDGSIHVSAAPKVPSDYIDRFVISRADLIRAARHRFSLRTPEPAAHHYESGEIFYILSLPYVLQVSCGDRDTIECTGDSIRLTLRNVSDEDRRRHFVQRLLDKECLRIFTRITEDALLLFPGLPMPTIRIRDMKSRWGSCLFKKNTVTLNKRLLGAPERCVEYVVIHELCHFFHPNHSKDFYACLSRALPDWKERKKLLNSAGSPWL